MNTTYFMGALINGSSQKVPVNVGCVRERGFLRFHAYGE